MDNMIFPSTYERFFTLNNTTMKFLTLALLLLAGWFAPSLAAQEPPSLERLTKTLDLSDLQIEEITAIQDRFRTAVTKSRNNKSASRSSRMADMGKARASRDREIMEILSDAQRDIYIRLEDERKAEIRRRHRPSRN